MKEKSENRLKTIMSETLRSFFLKHWHELEWDLAERLVLDLGLYDKVIYGKNEIASAIVNKEGNYDAIFAELNSAAYLVLSRKQVVQYTREKDNYLVPEILVLHNEQELVGLIMSELEQRYAAGWYDTEEQAEKKRIKRAVESVAEIRNKLINDVKKLSPESVMRMQKRMKLVESLEQQGLITEDRYMKKPDGWKIAGVDEHAVIVKLQYDDRSILIKFERPQHYDGSDLGFIANELLMIMSGEYVPELHGLYYDLHPGKEK